MALISPILDDRSYAQLKEELVRRISVYTPEWTDHNESDPGIALLELFAYLGESTLFRFNQIPETTKIEFLRLLGVRPRTARPATALLAAETDDPAGVALDPGTDVRAGSVVFTTTGATQVWPVEVSAVGKWAADEPGDSRAEADRRADARMRAGLAAEDPAVFYVTTAVPTDPLAAGATPLDVSRTLDHSLWVAVLGKKATDLTALEGRSLFVALAFDEDVPRPFDLEDRDLVPRFRSPTLTADPPPMLWRLWSGPGEGYTTLDVGDDTTRGLVTSGVVEVLLPRRLPRLDPPAPGLGAEDEPPPLDDGELADRVVAWLQVSRPATDHLNDAIPPVRWVGVNGVLAEHARSAATESLGTGTGDADQLRPLTQHPVLPGTVHLQVEEGGTWQDWAEVETYVVSGPDDRHFVVDHAAGSVHFGGLKVPQLGERIRVLTYRYGGGVAGNVPAGALTALSVGGVKVTNPLPAVGGSDAASLTDALDAIPAHLHRNDRAVVADDFAELAEEVTGVARAETLPLLHPDSPHVDSPGVVSVLVFPAQDLTTPQAPLPGIGLLRRVAAYLDERRLVTTELYVVPPTYRLVTVSMGLAVRAGYQVDAVRRWVDTILRQYLAPLPPLGPDGGGWPLGRAVRVAELEAVAVQVEGVEYVTGSLLGVPEPTGYASRDVVLLDRWEVPQLVDLVVAAGDPLPLGEAPRPPDPDGTLVPLPPDVC